MALQVPAQRVELAPHAADSIRNGCPERSFAYVTAQFVGSAWVAESELFLDTPLDILRRPVLGI